MKNLPDTTPLPVTLPGATWTVGARPPTFPRESAPPAASCWFPARGWQAFERAITLDLARGGEVGPEGFRWLRKAAGLKAVRLAELLDVTPMQVSRWENGRKPLERRAVALVSALALEKAEGKAA